jgi:cyclophilin family peptidyl-prolyl cis-trans isomerase
MKKITTSVAILIVGIAAFIAFLVINNTSEAPINFEIASNTSQQENASQSLDNSETILNVIDQAEESRGETIQKELLTNTEQIMKATFTTNKGNFEIELFNNLAPKTVENFVTLAESDFYNGIKFHRVIADFMVQGGDPLTKDDEMSDRWGTGGPGYTFEDEIHVENNNAIGTISMANAGPNTNGSQFFINTANNDFLDTKHTVFGKIVSGMETISDIEAVEKFPNDRPVEAVVIESVTISK